jgi:uncharacterized protein YjeT (DUF2065 family)
MIRTINLVLALLAVVSPLALAFAPSVAKVETSALNAISRRDVVSSGSAAILFGILGGLPKEGLAFQQQLDDHLTEPSQLPTDGKYDLNSAFVGEYKNLQGMYPHAAGKIAANGPYQKVKDIYSIEGLTKRDKDLFKKYEHLFTVNPAGRAFKERINARVST